ncbi:MAG: group III truncated hemoglobin [Filimonas sp.]|nr:group III truncated hemoglobin [Filimonas sp.]
MKGDITSRQDINVLLEAFYAKAINDDVIGFFFTEVTNLDLVKHLPVIGAFWENVLFGTGDYKGNPMQVHKHIHHLSPFNKAHFDRWVTLFQGTVDELFEGEVAERAKQRAQSIATVMQIKVIYGGIG